MVSVLLGLLLRLSRGINLLLGGIVGRLSVLELLCRLLRQLGSRLCDRLVTGGNGVLYRTTPPPEQNRRYRLTVRRLPPAAT